MSSNKKVCRTCFSVYDESHFPKARLICKSCYNKTFRDRTKAKKEKLKEAILVEKDTVIAVKDTVIAEKDNELNTIIKEREELKKQNMILKEKLRKLVKDDEKTIKKEIYNNLVFHISKLNDCIKNDTD